MKHIKITGCHDPLCPVYKFKAADGMICHRITYKAEIGKEPFNEIDKHIANKTIHPDCPLDDYGEPFDVQRWCNTCNTFNEIKNRNCTVCMNAEKPRMYVENKVVKK